MTTITDQPIVVCPKCGEDLQNVPHRNFAICANSSCRNEETYTRVTGAERTKAKRAMLPLASRLSCHSLWWTLDGMLGIYLFCSDRDRRPDLIKARYRAPGGTRAGESIGWFERATGIEEELRTALGYRVAS